MKRLTYAESIELVVRHVREYRGCWELVGNPKELIRRNGNAWTGMCPIASMRPQTGALMAAKLLGLPNNAVRAIVDAADNTPGNTAMLFGVMPRFSDPSSFFAGVLG